MKTKNHNQDNRQKQTAKETRRQAKIALFVIIKIEPTLYTKDLSCSCPSPVSSKAPTHRHSFFSDRKEKKLIILYTKASETQDQSNRIESKQRDEACQIFTKAQPRAGDHRAEERDRCARDRGRRGCHDELPSQEGEGDRVRNPFRFLFVRFDGFATVSNCLCCVVYATACRSLRTERIFALSVSGRIGSRFGFI
jgi:hypothetical protein